MNPGEEAVGDIARAIVKDLAALAEAQAGLTRDFVRLLDLLSAERTQTTPGAAGPVPAGPAPGGPAPVQPPGRPATPEAIVPTGGPARFGAAPPRPGEAPIGWQAEPRSSRPEPSLTEWRLETPSPYRPSGMTAVTPPPPAEEARPAAPAPALAPAPPPAPPPAQPLEPPLMRPTPPPEAAAAPLAAPAPSAAPAVDRTIEYLITPEISAPIAPVVAAHVAGGFSEETVDVGEGPDETEGTEPSDATVLVLESGNARVAVLWDQVVQVGSLTAPTVPALVETERGQTDLVSLGMHLHGVSRHEKYFVVLEQEGERAAVACERMLGLGPLSSASEADRDTRIQVLRVPLLQAFAKGNKGKGWPDPGERLELPGGVDATEADERDRRGPFRALVAVRYLPARVAICRHLRGHGWQVGEAAGLEAANVSLDLGRWDVLFLEVCGNGDSEETESTILKRVAERGIPVVRVGSRISGFPKKEGLSVMFPFVDSELDTILRQIGDRSSNK